MEKIILNEKKKKKNNKIVLSNDLKITGYCSANCSYLVLPPLVAACTVACIAEQE